MNWGRFSQIRQLKYEIDGGNSDKMERLLIESSVIDNNLVSLNKNKELVLAIQKYINEFITSEEFSFEYFEWLLTKLSVYKWINLQKNVSISMMLYNLICNVVLLPNYLTDWNQEKNYTEIKIILDRYLANFNKEIEILITDDYCLELWNLWQLIMEANTNDTAWEKLLSDRMFHIWAWFGKNYFSYDYDKKKYVFKIPIDIKSKQNKYKKTLKLEAIQNFTMKCLKEYASQNNIDNISISLLKENDTLGTYSDSGISSEYVSIILAKDENITNNEKMFIYLKELILLNNYIINEFIKNFWFDIEKEIHLFSSGQTLIITRPDKRQIEVLSKAHMMLWNNPNIDFDSLKLSNTTWVTLNDVWWQEKAKEQIEIIIDMIKRESIYKKLWARLPKWIIFEWPSGTGKTLLARVIAHEINAEIYDIKSTDIQSSAYINEWSKNIKDLFIFLRYKNKHTDKKIIVILDEIDLIFKKRWWSNSSPEDSKIVTAFLTELNGINELENVIFIGTTNLLETIDDAIIRSWRLENKVKVDIPDIKALEQIYTIHISKLASEWKILFSDISIQELAKESNWLVWADVENIVNKLIIKKTYDSRKSNNIDKISYDDFEEVLKTVKKESKNKMWFLG